MLSSSSSVLWAHPTAYCVYSENFEVPPYISELGRYSHSNRLSHVYSTSFNACHPVLHRETTQLLMLVASLCVAGFVYSERLPISTCVTMLNQVRLMLRPTLRLNDFSSLSLGFISCRYRHVCQSDF